MDWFIQIVSVISMIAGALIEFVGLQKKIWKYVGLILVFVGALGSILSFQLGNEQIEKLLENDSELNESLSQSQSVIDNLKDSIVDSNSTIEELSENLSDAHELLNKTGRDLIEAKQKLSQVENNSRKNECKQLVIAKLQDQQAKLAENRDKNRANSSRKCDYSGDTEAARDRRHCRNDRDKKRKALHEEMNSIKATIESLNQDLNRC